MRRRKYIEKDIKNAVEEALQSHSEIMSYLRSAQSDHVKYKNTQVVSFLACQ